MAKFTTTSPSALSSCHKKRVNGTLETTRTETLYGFFNKTFYNLFLFLFSTLHQDVNNSILAYSNVQHTLSMFQKYL